MFAVTQNLVHSGSLSPHSQYGPVLSIVAIPLYLFGLAVAKALHFVSDYPIKAVVSFTNAIVTACTCVLVSAVARRLDVKQRVAYLLALTYGLCTIAWPYAKTFFSEPLTAFWLLLTFWSLLHVFTDDAPIIADVTSVRLYLRSRRQRPVLWMFAAFSALGLGFLTRETTLITLPIFVVYTAFRGRIHPLRDRLYLTGGITLVLSLIAVALVNVVRFGRVGATGYSGRLWTTDFLSGLYGLLIGPYKGLFLFVPLTLMAVLCWPRFYRQRQAEALLCGGIFVVYLTVHSAYIDWPGGGNWGPRFLLPALPFLLLALPFGWSRTSRWTLATIALCIVGLAVQLPAVYAVYTRYYPVVGTNQDLALTVLTTKNPLKSPIVVQWQSVPIVTAQLRSGLRTLPGARSDLSQRESTQPTQTLPLNQVLRRSITVNVPDFWFVYLSLSGHLSRALRILVIILGVTVAGLGVTLATVLLFMSSEPSTELYAPL